ncbi:hypothetical protein ACH47B_31730 [Rhodococcus sp. NPDC019627]|uniref:hypothetical protein n=1 Tax=unclassified Rhodococcus (in: high G+C Gram-positive bacteria) TaxID=192944 RepID=UPI0033DB5957
MPLIPVTPGAPSMDERMERVLLASNIDGIKGRGVLPEDVVDRLSDRYATRTQWLLRQLVEAGDRPRVQTCRGVSSDNPWYIGYLAVFGDLPDGPNRESNRWNDLRGDLTFADVVDVETVDGDPSAADLVARIGEFDRATAVSSTRTRLATGMSGGYNQGLPSSSRFSWGQRDVSAKYGPNILVAYEPGSVEDLALIWNLRARFAHPNKFPLAVPITGSIEQDLEFFAQESSAHHFFGLGHDLALTSCSVSRDRLNTLAAATDLNVVDPWELLGEIPGYCVSSAEVVQFSEGEATVAAFSPNEIKELGHEYLGSSHATWLTLTTTVKNSRLPASPAMRRARGQRPGYLHGKVSHVGKLDEFVTLQHPTGLEVLRALATDRSLQARTSTPGKAAEHLIRAAGGELSMFTSAGVTRLLTELTRRGHASLVKRRLDQYLAGSDAIPGDARYDELSAKLDQALGVPDLDEVGYMNFNRLKQLLDLSQNEATRWIDWAVRQRVLLRGVEAKCPHCAHRQWRTLADAIPELVCHGCGLTIDNPFGPHKIDYQYRASEALLRAMGHDVLSAILAIRHISRIFGRRDGAVFGAYPGVELLELGSKTVSAEIDVLVVLGNGQWLIGECKTNARGLNENELSKLWTAADRVNAPATFTATLDRSTNCSNLWKITEDPNGRPHFALTAEHLYDLQAMGPTYDEEFFAWRDDWVRRPARVTAKTEDGVGKEFGSFLLRKAEDLRKRMRAPWDEVTE